ncbi:MAG: BON domain-containing protein [Candidatus Korobacteraceae bacterium]|jgi:osmotically-inducible protein OsmY
MGKAQGIVAVVLLVTSLTVAAGAQASQPPMANQSISNQPAQGQAPSESMSSETQAKLMKAINHALIMLPYYGVFDNLAYELQGRTVILQGQVARSILKPDAEKAVKKVEGVEKVVNHIEVLPPSPLDQQIRQRVRQAIYGGYGPLFKYANMPNPPIRIIVKNSRVTLEGVVDNETDKNLCTMRVNQVSSVLSVTNNLRVVKPG